MAYFQLSVLFGLGLFITQINGECVVDFQNVTVSNNGSTCSSFSNSTLDNILTCSGIQLSDLSQGNLSNLIAFTDSAFDLYTLLRSRLDVSLVVSSINKARSNGPQVGALSDVDFARLWFQVKLSPFLSSLSIETLSCLSQSSLSCLSFQALVKDLSVQIGPERQRMVYQNFIKPFLARNTTDAGCVKSANSTEEWFLQNFQTFSASASLGDFKALKQNFNGLVVLDQLSPEQKAELIFQLEATASLNIDAINQIFQSFLLPLTNMTLNMTSVTSIGLDKNLTDFLVYLRPLGRFIRSCVTIAQTTNISSVRNETIQLLVNWTLNFESTQTIINTFNISNFREWFQIVVTPVMKKYLKTNQTLPDNDTAISTFVFAPEPQIADPVEIRKVTSNNSSCLISQNEKSLAKVVNCVAQSNLSFNEENLRLLITELSRLLQTQMEQSVTNSSQSILTALFAELPAESFTSGNLRDVEFMKFWFQIKMKPLLPKIPREFLSWLCTRSFSCQAYNALFVAINDNSGLMESATKRSVLSDFIIPFLSQRQNTSVDCTLPFNNSFDFILQNFGSFFPFAQLQDISKLSRNFSAVEVLPVLTPVQLNELVFSPPASPADRTNILTGVFDFLLQAPNRDKLNNFLPSLQTQARKANFSCENYKTFFDKMDQTLSQVPSNQSEALLMIRDSVMMIPPDECIVRASQCTTTPVNESSLCASVNSSALDQFLKEAAPNATGPLNICNFTVLQFACRQTLPQLNSQQVADVLACKQPSNVGKEPWKLFFTKTSSNLDDALLKFSNMTPSPSSVFLSDVLDVLVDVRVDRFSPQRLRDPVFIRSWFQERLKPFLPSVSQRVLSCLSNKNLTCESYRTIFVAINDNSGLMESATKRSVLSDFIIPFLSQRQNTSVDCTLPFNNSLDFILQNFGSFFPFAQLQDISKLSRNFSAVEVLPVLTPVQLNELVFSPPASPADRTNILTGVFDFLLQAPNRDKLNNFLPSLQTQARKANFSCENYKTFFDKMDQTLSQVPSNQSEALLMIRDSVMMIPPDECIVRASQCTTTPVNESSLCASVNSSALDQFLKEAAPNATGPLNICNFTVLQFACRQTLPQLNSQQVADVLACKQPSNVGKEPWKLFFTKTSSNLDDALLKFSNMTPSPSSVFLSDVLDVLVDVRVDRFSPQRLRDPVFIRSWFQERLKPFLPSVSQRVLSCLSNKNLTCESYRTIFVAINDNSGLMESATKRSVLSDFIIPFLSQRQNTSVDCTLPFNNSLDFILQNFGSFFPFAQLQDISKLSRNFSAVEVLPVLTPVQLNELVFSPPASPADRTNILTGVFDFLLQAPNRDKLNNFLPSLQTQARKANFSCENYKTFFDKMDQTLSQVPSNQSEALLMIRDSVMMIPPDECIVRASQCTTTPVNESSLCASVNSSALDQFLKEAAPNATGPLNICNFTVLQFACRQTLPQLNSQQVADVLACKQPSNVGKEPWKLFFTKTSSNLDDALLKFSNMTPSPSSVFLSDVLDVLVDVRVDRFSPQRLRDPVFIRSWFQKRLKPFLPSVSQRVLSCLSNKNLTCESYRTIFVAINDNSGLMESATKRSVLSDFIIPFLSQRQNTSVDCTLPFNNSLDFILQNFGSFFPFAQLQDISKLSRNFSAVEVLPVLTPVQLNELVFSPPASPADRTNILTGVFDFLLQAPNRDKLNNFLPSLQTQARKANFSCENYKTFFDKMDQTLSQVPSNQSEALLMIRDSVMMIPPDECIERASQCTTTPVNESSLCASVNSSALDQFLKEAAPNATGPLNICNFTVLQFACRQTLPQLNSQQVADVLACKQPSNVGKEPWKLFFTKTSSNLDDALLKFSNMTPSPSPSSVFLSDVLDVLVDVRVDRFSPQRLRDPVFIRSWFQERLKPFLPSVSQRVLSCLSNKNLTCESYRTIFVAINDNSGLMESATKRSVLSDFIIPFLSQRQNTSVDCTLPFNNSLDFILQNFGSFFPFAQLQDISKLSRNFSAVEVLPVLTPVQLNELVFSPPASPADRTNILTGVFDFLLQAPNRDKLNNFLPSLQTQARKANFSCENYKTFFDKMDQTLSQVPSNQSEALLMIRDSVMMIPPDECIERASQCTTTPVNESSLCASVNSSALDQFLKEAAPNATGPLNICNFTVLQFACRQTLPQLNSQQVADVLACKQPSNVGKEPWKLFFTKTSSNLDDALLKFSNMTPSPSSVFLADVLDVLVDVRVDRFSPQRLRDPVFIRSWFQKRLKPFLPSISQRVLSCLSNKNLTCESYRTITEAFVNAPLRDGQDVCRPLQPNATQRQDLIYTDFMKAFLSRNDTNDPRCLRDTTNSTQWVIRNFGPFVQSANLTDLVRLNRNFTAVEVLPILGLKQLVEFSVSPGALTDPRSVINVMQLVKDCQLPAFFDLFSPNVQANLLSPDVKAALIKQIFDRASLSNLSITDQEVQVWFQDRLNPLLANFSESLVSPFFTILSTRDCNITKSALRLLGAVRSSVTTNAKNAIYNSILQSFRGPQPLRCYRNNSFITFLNESLYGFGPLPNLTTFLSLMPQPQKSELINSISPSELGTYLRQLEVVNNDSQICVIFNNFVRTPEFLETEEVPDNLKSTILPCVWPLALTSDNQTVVDLWFDRRLGLYLKFLNKDILGSKDTLNASCLSYRKMVNVLGNNFTFNGSQISMNDVYNTINTYLKADTAPKCYNPSDTAWFVNHIGIFITFLSLDDLYSFGPESMIKIFTVNPENIKLFNKKTLPKNILSRYTELIFLQNLNFDLFDLPSVLQCDAPVSVFTKLNESQTNTILGNFKSYCSNVDPAISTALAGNIKTIDANAISNLGNEVVGLTTVQINSAPPSAIISELSTLSKVSGWSLGQAKAVIRVLLSGAYEFTNSSSLLNLGSLIGGISSTVLTIIKPEQILTTITNTNFVKNMLSAPEIVQKTFVTQIIKVGSSPAELMKNIPIEMAVQIPRNLMNIPTTLDAAVLKQFNNKKWKPEQAVLFFDTVANVFEQPDDLSVEVLQGFTCSRVQTLSQTKVRGLIKACRQRENRPKVVLSETQLTCMYNLVRKESTVDFASYHPDMLLYFNYETINKTLCKAYFAEVGAADLSIFSSTLSERRKILWSNAVDCFGINGTSIKKQDLAVLGNLVCAAKSDFITNSDPEILENLKNCNDLSDVQISAMETVLMKGTSKYGTQGNWNQKTLGDLGILPLFFSQNFWGSFRESDLRKFFKTFLRFVRVQNTPKPRMKRLFKAIILPTKKAKRAAGACTKGSISSVTINDDAFPFGYDELQFSNCLNADVVRDNLASLCEKIEDSAFQRIILDKLNEILPSGLSEDQVQLLKSVSRMATADELSKWNITKADTLAALMNANDGEWSSTQSKLIITKYLSANNTLTATELSIVKGPNLCSLSASTLSTISPESIKWADALNVSKCSSDKKKALFTIANKAFHMPSVRGQSDILSAFQLIEPYLGGADLGYIRNMASYNVSMSLSTFINLDADVITNLTVSEVVGLLGINLQDLKTFENEIALQTWILLQIQSELDKLNLGLTGGKADATTASPAANTTVKTTIATTIKTTSGAPGIGRSGWSVSLSILVLIFTIIKVEII